MALMTAQKVEDIANAFGEDATAFVQFLVAFAPKLEDDNFAGEVVDAITDYDANDDGQGAEVANNALNTITDRLVMIFNGEV